MRIKCTIFSLVCLLLACPCVAGPVGTPVTGPATEAMPAAGNPFVLAADVFADDANQSAEFSDSLLFGKEAQPATSASASGNPDIGIAIDAAALERLRGGESTVDNDVLLDGTVENTNADHIVSGANAISDGAFTNANGINTVIQNSGSNVLIQNGMVVNVQFVAPTP
jgi:hypothetical protein